MPWYVIVAFAFLIVLSAIVLILYVYLSAYERRTENTCPFADREKQKFLFDDEDDVMWSQH